MPDNDGNAGRTPRMPPSILWTGVPVGTGVSGACWVAIAGDERAAVGKRNNADNGNGYVVFNEIICHRLAVHLGLPTPDSFVHRDPGPLFVQLNFRGDRDWPPAVDPLEVVARFPALAAKILVFDILVLNTDRHAGNLQMRSGTVPELVVIDHSHALFGGRGHNPGPERLDGLGNWTGCDGRLGNRHCLMDALDDAGRLDQAVQDVSQLPDSTIREAVREASGHGLSLSDAEKAQSVLVGRRKRLSEIMQANRSEFRRIHQWTL